MRTVAFDSTMVNAVQLCPERFNLEFLQNWRPTEKAAALENGDLVHRMLAHYYRRKIECAKLEVDFNSYHGQIVSEAHEVALRAAVDMDLGQADVENDVKQFKEYVLHWQYDGWTPLEVEIPFSKVLYKRDDESEWRKGGVVVPQGTDGANFYMIREGITVLYEGIIDLKIREPHGELVVVDHKTAGRRTNPSRMSTQFTGYCWAFDGLSVIVNKIGFQKSLTAAERFQRPWLRYERPIIEEWKKDTLYWIFKAIQHHDAQYFPHNRTSCDKYSGCIFEQICSSIPAVRPFKLQAHYFVGEKWSPYTRDGEPRNPTDESLVE